MIISKFRAKSINAILIIFAIASFHQLFILQSNCSADLSISTYIADYYSIQLPSDWKVEQDLGQTKFIFQDGKNKFIIFSSKVDFTTEEWVKLFINKIKQEKNTILLSEGIVLDGWPAHKLIYVTIESNETYRTLRLFMVKNRILYDIVYRIKDSRFDEYIDSVNRAVETFKTKLF